MSERKQILSYLRKWLVEHCASSPPATGGMPSPAHVAHWAKQDLLKEIIEDIEQGKHTGEVKREQGRGTGEAT